MLTLFGNCDSGNVHKVQMILRRRRLEFCRVDVRQDNGEARDPRFLKINGMGKVPAVRLGNGEVLSDSGALLFFFSSGTSLWPDDHRARTEVLRWMFFEQYSHEPALAVLRYLRRFAPDHDANEGRVAELLPKADFVLRVLEKRLAESPWIAGHQATIADYALYPYTRWMEEVGFGRQEWPAISRWFDRFEQLPNFLPLYGDAAISVVEFDDYFGAAASSA